MKNEIVISVIVPIYNVEKYLFECLESLRNQTCSGFEVIMVDDGSTDDSYSIANEIAQIDSRFILTRQLHSGLGQARNNGMLLARGEYVVFLDSDDYYVFDALEQMKNAVLDYDLDVMLFSANSYDENGIMADGRYTYDRKFVSEKVIDGKTFLKMECDNFITSACLLVVRREMLLNNNILFAPEIIHEDNSFFYETLLVGRKVLSTNEKLYCRRVRNGSIMTSYDLVKGLNGYVTTVILIDEFLKQFHEDFIIEYLDRWIDMIIDIYSRLDRSDISKASKDIKKIAKWMRENRNKYTKRRKFDVFCRFPLIARFVLKL